MRRAIAPRNVAEPFCGRRRTRRRHISSSNSRCPHPDVYRQHRTHVGHGERRNLRKPLRQRGTQFVGVVGVVHVMHRDDGGVRADHLGDPFHHRRVRLVDGADPLGEHQPPVESRHSSGLSDSAVPSQAAALPIRPLRRRLSSRCTTMKACPRFTAARAAASTASTSPPAAAARAAANATKPAPIAADLRVDDAHCRTELARPPCTAAL